MVLEGELLSTPRTAFVEGFNLHRYVLWSKSARAQIWNELRAWLIRVP